MPPKSLSSSESWESIKEVATKILKTLPLSAVEFMQCYTTIHNYCTKTEENTMAGGSAVAAFDGVVINIGGSELYYLLRAHVESYLQGHVQEAASLKSESEDYIISFYVEKWAEFTRSAVVIHNLFNYLNRMWIKRKLDEQTSGIYDIYTLCLILWRDCLLSPLHGKLLPAILKQIYLERKGTKIEPSVLKKAITSFVTLGIDAFDFKKTNLTLYVDSFEKSFLAETETFYREASASYLTENGVTEYLKKSQTWLDDEDERVVNYLHPSTKKRLIGLTESVLLTAHSAEIQEQFQPLLEREKLDDLGRMYALLSRVPDTLVILRDTFERHIKEQGLLAIRKIADMLGTVSASGSATNLNEPKSSTSGAPSAAAEKQDIDPKIYCDALLQVYTTFSTIANVTFQGEAGFIASLDKACREFVNRNVICPTSGSNKSAELIAKQSDALLRKSSKMSEDAEMEASLDGIMTIFKFIEDKDVFQKFYTKNLAKRLVNGTSSSDDSETSMISKLKEACGFEYTNKLQKMFQDMGVSKDLNTEFKDKMEVTHGGSAIDFSILVLCSGSWPMNAPTTDFNIPKDLMQAHERFISYYQSKHQGRKLTWLTQQSKGDVTTNFGDGKSYTFNVSTYQIGLLLPYNSSLSYTFQAFQDITALSVESLRGNLSLLCKAKLLIESESNGPEPAKVYTLNLAFKSKKIRMNLNIAIKSETKAEVDETHKTVEKDRELVIQAAIVRIMKTRKAMRHTQLVDEVLTQLSSRFKPRIPDIKRCIDLLLEKEYMERMESDSSMYSYMA